MNPTTLPDPTENLPRAPAASKDDGFNPVLLRLKQEAEDEVKRLRAELASLRDALTEAETRKSRIDQIDRFQLVSAREERERLAKTIPSDLDWAKLKDNKARLETELAQAERRLEIELAMIREAEIAPAPTGGRVSRANRELTELLEVARRILPEYADKLDRITQSALTVWEKRDHISNKLIPPYSTALERLGDEFRGLSEPLKRWIHKLSAAYEEGRLTEVQRMELGLRLIDLETKFQTAQTILGQLGVL